jgi:hypothetical protein
VTLSQATKAEPFTWWEQLRLEHAEMKDRPLEDVLKYFIENEVQSMVYSLHVLLREGEPLRDIIAEWLASGIVPADASDRVAHRLQHPPP